MPYRPEHKVETRKRIVSSARKLFNRRGLSDVSIDEIMADAGLTRGGFYNHFSTKEDLYAEAVTEILNCEKVDANGKPFNFDIPPDRIAQEVIASYLSDIHFNDRDSTCSLVAFPSDAARGGPAVREAYQQVLERMLSMFEAGLGDGEAARERAIAVATLCIGGMVIARAVDDTALGDEFRQTVMKMALDIGGFEVQHAVAAE